MFTTRLYSLIPLLQRPSLRLLNGGALLAAVAILFFTQAVPVNAMDITVVQADGTAIKTKEVPNVKGAAIDDAIKNAVAEALETIIENENLEVDPSLVETKIYANAVNFVVNFKILSEERFTEDVEVEPEDSADRGSTENGATSVSPEKKDLKAGPETKTVERYHIWLEARVDSARLKEAVGKIVLTREGPTPVISIVVLDITDFKTYSSIKDALKRVTLIKEITYDSFYPGRFVFRAKTIARTPALVTKIAKEAGEDFIVARGKKGTIIIKAFPRTLDIK